MCEDILKERNGALQFPSVDSLGGFAGVLEADAEVRAARAGALRARDGLFSVADLRREMLRLVSSDMISWSPGVNRLR